MKKLYSLLLAGIMVLSLTACGGGEETAEQSAPQTTAAAQAESSVKTEAGTVGASASENGSQWDNPAYSRYTNGLDEPEFKYTIKGVIMEQMTVNAEATEAEVTAWKQSLIDKGFEQYREGEQWGIKNDTHNIQMNGFVNGIAYIYIGLVQ